MIQYVLGIDPGLSGALAIREINAPATCYPDVKLIDVPITVRKVNKKDKKQIDLYHTAAWLELQRPYIKFAVIEQVGAMPSRGAPGSERRGMGVTSAFNFGFTTGALHGIIAACGIPIRTVPPQVWKRKFGLLGQDKDASRGEASRRCPQHAHLWPLKEHDGRAEAVLLAIYGSLWDTN